MGEPGSLFLVVGLGNPGQDYEGTRHNVGFEVIDCLASQWKLAGPAKRFSGLLWEHRPDAGPKVLLLKPQTYMNLSGKSVAEAIRFHKLEPNSQLLVISDDLDLPPGHLRLRLTGGSGGHNGLKSIIEVLGGEQFPRMRMGIGRSERIPTEHYVLKRPSKEDRKLLDDSVIRAAAGVEKIFSEGFARAMESVNRREK